MGPHIKKEDVTYLEAIPNELLICKIAVSRKVCVYLMLRESAYVSLLRITANDHFAGGWPVAMDNIPLRMADGHCDAFSPLVYCDAAMSICALTTGVAQVD